MAYSGILAENSPVSNSTSTEFTLHVNNLPEELSEHGFLEIFNHYGKVIGHFYRPNAVWGYITYGNSYEAQNAIKDLNNVLPLRLKVSLTRGRSNEVNFAKAPVSNNEKYSFNQENRCTDTLLTPRTGSGKPMDIFKKIEPNVGLPNYTADSDLLYNYPTDPFTYNPYENTEPYANTNALWTRGHLCITQNGKRHVSLGRGYTKYEIPDPNPEILNHISKVYEKRTSGLYEFGNDSLECEIGKCRKCSKITKFICEGCPGFFYCSRNCQEIDWPQHKIECQSIPALVTMTNSTKTLQIQIGQTHTRNLSSFQLPLRRPKQLPTTTDLTKHHSNNEDMIKTSTSTNNNVKEDLRQSNAKSTDQCKRSQNEEESIPTEQIINEVKNDKNTIQSINMEKYANNSFKKSQDSLPYSDKKVNHKRSENSDNNGKKRQNFNVNDIINMEAEIAFPKNMFLSKSKFTEVKIILNEGREYWVQKLEDVAKMGELMINLQSVAEKAQQKAKAVVGKLYAVKYENIWHRALVKSLDPLTVHYIDFGNDEVVKTIDLRLIPEFENVQRYATKIRISEKAYEKHKDLGYGSQLYVKLISFDANRVIDVEVQGENDETAIRNSVSEVQTSALEARSLRSVKSPTFSKIDTNKKGATTFTKPQNVVNIASVGELGFLEIHAELSNSVYSITLLLNDLSPDFEKLLSELPATCEEKVENFDHRPQVGELICGQRLDGDWLRGYVLSLDKPLKMAIIDEARVMEITKTMPCPDGFLSICSFGVTCKIMDTKHKLTTGEHYDLKVLARRNKNEVKIEIGISDQEKIMAIVKPWMPMPEQVGLRYATLKNKSEVCLSAYRSHVHMYARPLDTASKNYYNHIMQSAAKCAQTASSLNEPPVVGQMVLANYIDNNYYRAIVTRLQGNEITIVYYDFGNIEIVTIKKLMILSDELKQLPSCTAKIILKDVPQDIPMTKEISNYLNQLVGKEEPMICTFEGIPLKDGVHLHLNGKSINKIISEMLVPIWNKIGEEDTTCYMLNDIEVAPLGKVGDITEACVLHSHDDDYTYSMCPLDYDLMSHIFDTMSNMMTEYCKKSKYYIPRENELCLALYDDIWCRAACVDRSKTPTASLVFFIDNGNFATVDHENLRLMPIDFITPKALANTCFITNLDPINFKNSAEAILIRRRIKKLIVPNRSYRIEIIGYDEKDGSYKVDMLDIRSQLIEEGLIPE
ncbi:vreteno [Megalopta genalis]|uniref:vreteno n=1 Tax=Megalopta genalis TaxID=115081 RepID=UPI003FD58AD3